MSPDGIGCMGDSMKKSMPHKQKRYLLLRSGAVLLAAAGILALPVDWCRLGKTAAVMAAGLQHPSSLCTLLEAQLQTPSSSVQTVVPPAAGNNPPTAFERPGGGEIRPGEPQPPAAALPAYTHISPPGENGTGGKIYEQKMGTGDKLYNGIATTNRSGISVDVKGAVKRPLPFTFAKTADPQVLILHTHTTEQYMTYDSGYYNKEDIRRSQDHKKNVCAVGEAIRLTLEAHGIHAIHDTTVHDDPVYTGSYGRSAATAEKYLKKYPSIRVVLDVHRDSIMKSDKEVIKPTVTVNGKKAAQMMLVMGVVDSKELPHPQCEKNLTLAAHMQKELGKVHEDLMRPLNMVASRYNQHLHPGWMLLETGAEGNTVEEAVYAGQLFGQTLAGVLAPPQ